MKFRILTFGLTAITAIAFAAVGLAGVARAQSVPEKFVVSGKAADKINDFTTINLATAERLADTCEQAVTAHGGGEHTIVILDKNGNDVYMDRMDGQGYLNIITAGMKARTALMAHAPSKTFMNDIIKNPSDEFDLLQLGFYPVAGGLPIIVDKQLIGVIGVGGYRPNPPVWSDEICGHTALVSVFGPSVPPLIEDVSPRRNPNPAAAPVPRFTDATQPKPSVSPEFVVGGEGAAKIFDSNQISLATAKKIARVCRDWAASKGGTMSMYIIDNAGEFVHMERMDGQLPNDEHTALLKAETALRSREPTSILNAQVDNNPSAYPRNIDTFHFYTVSGGVPIVVDGQMIGALGVTASDGVPAENCAVEGLKATFGNQVTLPTYPSASAAAR